MSTTTNRETSSSTGIVFAKAKSEWVIPQRAKPGRKSSKVTAAAAAAAAGTNGGGTASGGIKGKVEGVASNSSTSSTTNNPNSTSSGSRDAQRAFRERKSEYITSLETRINAFERGEIQRNVALQSAARSLKEENTRLKVDLTGMGRVVGGLKGEVGRLEGVVRGLRGEVEGWEKRAREAEMRVRELQLERSLAGSGASSPGVDSMRMDGDGDADDVLTSGIMTNQRQTQPTISLGINKTTSTSSHLSPSAGLTSMNPPHPNQHQHSHSDPDLISDSDSISRQVAMDMACGFCEGIESVCVCRIVREGERVAAAAAAANHQQQQQQQQQIDGDQSIPNGGHSGIYPGTMTTSSSMMMMVNPVTKQLTPTYHAEITAAVRSTSILDNLPPVEAAVPLRRRVRTGSSEVKGTGMGGRKAPPIFAVSPAVSMGVAGVMDAAALAAPGILYIPPAECSGDPRNCPACKDDEFGEWACSCLIFKY